MNLKGTVNQIIIIILHQYKWRINELNVRKCYYSQTAFTRKANANAFI